MLQALGNKARKNCQIVPVLPMHRVPLECSRECSRGCPRKCTRSGLVVCHLVCFHLLCSPCPKKDLQGTFLSGKKKTNKHKHFRRDGVRDKQEPSLGQMGPLPGTKWDPSLGQTGLSLFNSTVRSPFCPVCPLDGWGFVPGTIVPQGPSEKCLCVLCLLVFVAPMKVRGQTVGYGMVVDGIAKFQALKFTFHGLKFPVNPLFCWLEGESLRNFRP